MANHGQEQVSPESKPKREPDVHDLRSLENYEHQPFDVANMGERGTDPPGPNAKRLQDLFTGANRTLEADSAVANRKEPECRCHSPFYGP